MSRLLNRLSTGLFALFVVGGLTLGTSAAFGATGITSCNGPGQLGSCPPYTTESCDDDCRKEGYDGGACLLPGPCCSCLT